MKNILQILLLLFIVSFLHSACNKDNSVDKTPFVGNFNVLSYCGTDSITYTASIVDVDLSKDAVSLISFPFDQNSGAYAEIDGNKLILPPQMNDVGNLYGQGTLKDNLLTIRFTYIDENDDTFECVAEYTKM